MVTQDTEIRIVCGHKTNPCGFNVDADYYRRKPKFTPGICPNCNWGIAYVDAIHYQPVEKIRMVRRGPSRGLIVTEDRAITAEIEADSE